MERLEKLLLLSTGCPVISGFVYLDQNQQAALTNNGHLDPGELPIPNAQVQLFDSSNHLIATTRTDSRGHYEFDGVPNPNARPVALPPQTLTFNPTLTNFKSVAYSPANLQLFDPELGTLTGITISRSTTLSSTITTQNLSPSPANINLALNGNYTVNGLNTPMSGTASVTKGPISDGPFDPANPDGNKLPPQTLSSTDAPPPVTLTSPSDLAFFTAGPGRTSIRPTLTANGFGTATSDSGALATTAVTSASAGALVVTYTYIPKVCFTPGTYRLVQTPNPPNVINGKTSQPGVVFPAPPAGQPQQLLVNVTTFDKPHNDFAKLIAPNPCPTPGPVIRFGVHHQPTELVLKFTGTVDPTLANNPANYTVITKNGQRIPIVSATFDPATNSVTLIPARRLNIHQRFDLSVNLPCNGPCNNVVIPFGGKASLGGFVNHQGRFVRFVNGHRVTT